MPVFLPRVRGRGTLRSPQGDAWVEEVRAAQWFK